ncbi:hypothetical protein Tco_1387951 [Tanacetum coccineum]
MANLPLVLSGVGPLSANTSENFVLTLRAGGGVLVGGGVWVADGGLLQYIFSILVFQFAGFQLKASTVDNHSESIFESSQAQLALLLRLSEALHSESPLCFALSWSSSSLSPAFRGEKSSKALGLEV